MGSGEVAISNSKQCEKENKNLVVNMWMRVKFLFLFRERVVSGCPFIIIRQTEMLMLTPNSCVLMHL